MWIAAARLDSRCGRRRTNSNSKKASKRSTRKSSPAAGSMVCKGVLPNGVRVLTEAMPHVVSATIGIWVENGSRYEHEHQNGVSHFIEHLLFKGTKKRTAAQIAEQFDSVGGVLNAFTGKEYTCYYAKVLGADLKMATELLADLFLESVFDPAEIDRERQVVLQEISQAEDTPDDFIHDLFNLHYWRGHPLALPIFGSVETVNAINREALVSFMADRYGAGRRDVVTAVPGSARKARPRLQHLFVHVGFPRLRLFRRLRGYESRLGRRSDRSHAQGDQQGRARRPRARGTCARQEPAQGQYVARDGVDGEPDEPAGAQRDLFPARHSDRRARPRDREGDQRSDGRTGILVFQD